MQAAAGAVARDKEAPQQGHLCLQREFSGRNRCTWHETPDDRRFSGNSRVPIEFEEILRCIVGIVSGNEPARNCASSRRLEEVKAAGSYAPVKGIKEGNLFAP